MRRGAGLLIIALMGGCVLAEPAMVAAQQSAAATPEAESAAPQQRTILRFLTDSDYPPFNYYDEDGTLTGFNVDFARAICFELETTCDIQAAEWAALLPALGRGETDAVIASIGITPDSLASADFTNRYYFTPARFIMRKDAPGLDITPEGLEARRIAVVKDTAHEAYLTAFFRDSIVVSALNEDAAREALVKGEADALFGDGLKLMFWLNGTSSAGCCEFRGGAFADERYFGDGVGIAVRKGDAELKKLIDGAIDKVRKSGRYEELLLRYFPLKIF